MLRLKYFLISMVLFVVFDSIWLGLVMKGFNLRQLADIGRIENGVFQMWFAPAAVAYVLMALAVTFYVLPQLTNQISPMNAFLVGAPMGLIIYGVFDTTNLAILKNYPLAFVFPDVAWGTFVFGLVSAICSAIMSL